MTRRTESVTTDPVAMALARAFGWSLAWIGLVLVPLYWALLTFAPTREGSPTPHTSNASPPGIEPSVSQSASAVRFVPASAPRTVATPLSASDVVPETPVTPRSPATKGALGLRIVTADSGEPAPFASVELGLTPSGEDSELVAVHVADENGRLAIDLEPGELRVVAWNEQSACGPEHIQLRRGSKAKLELELTPTRSVTGRVVDLGTGDPIAGANVRFWTFADEDRATTSADGTFFHPRFPATTRAQQVRVEAPGYGAAVRYLRLREDGSWSLPAALPDGQSQTGEGTPWIEIGLQRELVVRGRVMNAESRPIEAASIVAEGFFHVLPKVATRDGSVAASTTQGEFELTGLRADIGHSVTVRAEGYCDRTLEVGTLTSCSEAPCSHELSCGIDLGTIRLEPENVLAGVVVDSEGWPVEDIEVTLLYAFDGDDEPRGTSSPLDADVRLIGNERTARTSVDGVFVLERLSAGPHRLSVRRDGDPLLSIDVEITPDTSSDSLELQLPPEALILRGEVRAEDGVVPNAQVEVHRFGFVGRTRTDGNGRFRLAGLDDSGAYRVQVSAEDPRTDIALNAHAEVWGHEKAVLSLKPTPSGLAPAPRR